MSAKDIVPNGCVDVIREEGRWRRQRWVFRVDWPYLRLDSYAAQERETMRHGWVNRKSLASEQDLAWSYLRDPWHRYKDDTEVPMPEDVKAAAVVAAAAMMAVKVRGGA